MKCKLCGTELAPNTKICPKCGILIVYSSDDINELDRRNFQNNNSYRNHNETKYCNQPPNHNQNYNQDYIPNNNHSGNIFKGILLIIPITILAVIIILGISNLNSVENFNEETELFTKRVLDNQATSTRIRQETTSYEYITSNESKETPRQQETTFDIDSSKTFENIDPRVPNYKPENPTYVQKEYIWESYNGAWKFTIYANLNEEMYQYYRGLSRYYYASDYKNYIDDANNKELVQELTEQLKKLYADSGYEEYDAVCETINFVQRITYAYDKDSTGKDEFPKYPLETLYDQNGDCEDTSILLAGLLSELGYGTVLLEYPEHMAVGVKGSEDVSGSYFTYEGNRYYYIETTGENWKIGEIPEDYQEQSATIYKIN